jgi:uncharacterized membrane protein
MFGLIVIGVFTALAMILLAGGPIMFAEHKGHAVAKKFARAFAILVILGIPACAYAIIPELPNCDAYVDSECQIENLDVTFGAVFFMISFIASVLAALVLAIALFWKLELRRPLSWRGRSY